MRFYKLRRYPNGRKADGSSYYAYGLTVPTEIAEKLPRDLTYAIAIDEDGIHFRPTEDDPPPLTVPSWAREKETADAAA